MKHECIYVRFIYYYVIITSLSKYFRNVKQLMLTLPIFIFIPFSILFFWYISKKLKIVKGGGLCIAIFSVIILFAYNDNGSYIDRQNIRSKQSFTAHLRLIVSRETQNILNRHYVRFSFCFSELQRSFN